jgi:hypothetical protein
MELNIQFQSLDRIEGQEGRSKLIHSDSELYTLLHELKQKISKKYTVGSDRMDLHIEVTTQRRDPKFRQKAEIVHGQSVDLSDASNWGYLGRAFVLWTPEVEDYGRTHMTISFFGNSPRPDVATLTRLIEEFLAEKV